MRRCLSLLPDNRCRNGGGYIAGRRIGGINRFLGTGYLRVTVRTRQNIAGFIHVHSLIDSHMSRRLSLLPDNRCRDCGCDVTSLRISGVNGFIRTGDLCVTVCAGQNIAGFIHVHGFIDNLMRNLVIDIGRSISRNGITISQCFNRFNWGASREQLVTSKID